jgi:Sec-independent protein translocase protein TatA
VILSALSFQLALFGNLDLTEMLVILVFAIMIFGRNLPRVAAQVMTQFTRARSALREVWRESGIGEEIREVQRELNTSAEKLRAADPTRESRETFKSIEAEVRHSLQGGQVAESSHEDLHEPDHDESADPDAGRAAESGEPTGERDRRPSWYPEIQAPAPETAESNEPGPNPGEPESADSEPSEGH